MNDVWNLDVIYKGFSDPAFEEDLNLLKQQVEVFSQLPQKLPAMETVQGLREGIRLQEEINRLGMKLGEYAMLRQSANAADPEAGSNLGRIMSVVSATAAPEAAFKDWAAKLPNLMELVEGDEELKDYAFLFSKIQRSSKYLLSTQAEAVMAKLRLSGGNAWGDLQSYLTATVPVTYRGETTNLSAIRNMAYDSDPQVRKDAYEAEITCYERIRDAVAFALNSIKLETLSDCELRGYASPLDRTLENSDMERKTLEAMLGLWTSTCPSSGST